MDKFCRMRRNHLKDEWIELNVMHRSYTSKRTDYVGNCIYENGSLKRTLNR